VVSGLGVFANANQERLIASGTWPAGPRPTFGTDGAFSSEGNFLNAASAPFGNSIEASGANVTTSVVTLGDFNNSGTITTIDIGGFSGQFSGAPYNPAGDFNQSGTVTTIDIGGFAGIFTGPLVAEINAVPEPSTMGLVLLSAMGLITRRRRA
jgi:hypothetical protein